MGHKNSYCHSWGLTVLYCGGLHHAELGQQGTLVLLPLYRLAGPLSLGFLLCKGEIRVNG